MKKPLTPLAQNKMKQQSNCHPDLASELLSKYEEPKTPPGDPPPPAMSSQCWFPLNLIEICKYIISSTPPSMKKPLFQFSPSMESAKHNWSVLQDFNLDLEKALLANGPNQLHYGSEFKNVDLLELIFSSHPLWSRMKSHLSKGCSYPLEPLAEDLQAKDLQEAYEFGNHKGVTENKDLFMSIIDNEIQKGWIVVIPRPKVLEMKNVVLSPMNIASQFGINEEGEIIQKKRLTHNQSMEHSSKTSVNSRVREDELQDAMYGKCLLRVIHDIVDRRRRFKSSRILLQKIDFKSAYRRGHLSASSALKTITQCIDRDFALISLRLTFGGSPNPSFWGDIAEPIADLSNALLACPDWDHKSFYSSIQHKVPLTKESDDITPFAQALPMSVDPASPIQPKADIYIDDITTVAVDTGDNLERASKAVLLAIEIVARQHDPNDPVPRDHIVSISKLLAEAALEEQKILLGWHLDTRRLLVSLPEEKYIAWSNMIKDVIKRGSSSFDELDSLVGRLTHVTVIIPYSKHFMSRIRQEKKRAKNRKKIKLKSAPLEDLILHLDFLRLAREGISMNLLTYRKPSHVYRGDACPFGLGGYSEKGRAWRWYIPTELRFRATINMLEHLAAVIGPWIDLLEGNLPKFSCILSMTDSTTTAGWLRKSNFQYSDNESKEMTEAKLTIARSHASRLLHNKCIDYSQWFPGEENDVADALSRDDHLSDAELTSLLFSSVPSQMHQNFKISPLPPEIDSFLSSLLETLPAKTQIQEAHTRSKVSRGHVGQHSSSQSVSPMTSSSPISPTGKEQSSQAPLQKPSEEENFREKLALPFLQRQSAPPWTTFRRPFESSTISIPDSTRQERLKDFYLNSLKATKKKTQQKNKKKPSPSV